MTARLSLDRLLGSLADLGARRLAALAIVGMTVFALVGLGGYYLSRPELDILYSGLDREDVSRIGAALTEAGIGFDVNAEGDTVMVRFSQTAQARMLLAEKGLPHSANAGYELFDQLGSLGLTSFMQQITRVRAMEGELARTIQSMQGIKAARVHIVLPDDGSFRRERRLPSASVVIRSDSSDDFAAAQAIRHLVAAAVPGMSVDEVTVLNTDGELLASGDDAANAAPGRMATLENGVSHEIQENIRETLAPYLGVDNFQVSVAARLNTDKRQTTETIFDPESRVERSTRVIKEEEESQNSVSRGQTSVDQNLPEEQVDADTGEQSTAQNDRREEITNYELSSKTIITSSDGYAIDHLSIAVLVNRERLAETLGEGAGEEGMDAQLADIQALVASAAGLEEARGDKITVSAVDFLADADALAPVPPLGMGEILLRQTGTLVHAATILVVALLVIWFGLRPATRAILAHPKPATPANPQLAAETPPAALEGSAPAERRLAAAPDANLIEDLTSKLSRSPQKRLEQIIQFDEEHAASVLKQWIHQGSAA